MLERNKARTENTRISDSDCYTYPARGTLEFLDVINKGINPNVVIVLAAELDVSRAVMSSLVGMQYRTFTRRIDKGLVLDPNTSERALYIQSIYKELVSYFNDHTKANTWLKKPRKAFGNQTPLNLLRTYTGMEIVSDFINQMKHGFCA